MNMGDLMKQAQQFQERLATVQNELAGRQVSGSAGGSMVSVSTFSDSLVCPQPVAEQRLKTGTRISSRIEGMPRMRISPVCPEDQKP